MSNESITLQIDGSKINNLQLASIRRLIELCKHAHHADVIVRINGENRMIEADWIKHMTEADAEGKAE